MAKAKAKSDRAAARQAALVPINILMGLPASTSSTPTIASEAPTPALVENVPENQPQEGDDFFVSMPLPKDTSPDRTEMLRTKPEAVGLFMQHMVPILIDVYAASVTTTVRIKTLTGLLKAISFMDGEEAKRVLTVS